MRPMPSAAMPCGGVSSSERPSKRDPALAERVEARQAVEQRRLAGAVRADEADDVAARDRERDAVERDDAAEADRHVLDLEQRLGFDGAPRRQCCRMRATIGRAGAERNGALP